MSRPDLSQRAHDEKPYDTIAPMAKKKFQAKKHSFKHVEPIVQAGGSDVAQSGTGTVGSAATSVTPGRDFSYVGTDLRRILVIGGSLVLGEVVLWYLFGHTSLGTHVYNLVRL